MLKKEQSCEKSVKKEKVNPRQLNLQKNDLVKNELLSDKTVGKVYFSCYPEIGTPEGLSIFLLQLEELIQKKAFLSLKHIFSLVHSNTLIS